MDFIGPVQAVKDKKRTRRGGKGRRLLPSRVRAAIDKLIEPAMLSRGFNRPENMPGHWRSVSTHDHDLTIRHRALHNWMEEAFIKHGPDAAMKKLVGKVDRLIQAQWGKP